jgi:hypothetical protein
MTDDVVEHTGENPHSASSLKDFVKLLSPLPGASKEVVMKIFPDLSKLLSQGVETFNKMHSKASDSNDKSQDQAMSQHRFVAEVIAEQLRLQNLTPDERAKLINDLRDAEDKADKKDNENKKFILDLLRAAGTGALFALAIAVVIVGGGVAVKNLEA